MCAYIPDPLGLCRQALLRPCCGGQQQQHEVPAPRCVRVGEGRARKGGPPQVPGLNLANPLLLCCEGEHRVSLVQHTSLEAVHSLLYGTGTDASPVPLPYNCVAPALPWLCPPGQTTWPASGGYLRLTSWSRPTATRTARRERTVGGCGWLGARRGHLWHRTRRLGCKGCKAPCKGSW